MGCWEMATTHKAPPPLIYIYIYIYISLYMYIYVTNLGWYGQFHTESSVWLHGQLLLLKLLVRSLPATFYTILNMLSEWFKPTRSGSMVLSGHGKWLCSYVPRQLGSRTSVAGLPKPDSGPGPDSPVIWISSQTHQKYTGVYPEPIRSLLATS